MFNALLNRFSLIDVCKRAPALSRKYRGIHNKGLLMLKAIFFSALVLLLSRAEAQSLISSGYIKRDPSRKEVIVFVHGVVGNAKDTWTNEKTKAYWPLMIREDPTFSAANVWVFSYFSPKVENAQNVEELASKLGDEMRAQDVLQSHERTYFIAHSMGGLITREMLIQQLPAPSKVPLIFFFGTPSAGADLAGVAAATSTNPQFANMKPFTRESDVASFSRHWLATAQNPSARYPQRIWSFCAYEIEAFTAGKLIVNTSSASFLCSTPPRASLANHMTMVKPADATDEGYQYFVSAYKFSRSSEAKIVADAGAITLHSESSPGIQPGALRLVNVHFGPSIQVACDQVTTGEKRLKVSLEKSERLVAVQPKFETVAGVQVTSVTSTFDTSGAIRLGYLIHGTPAFPATTRCSPGLVDIGVQYLVEKQ